MRHPPEPWQSHAASGTSARRSLTLLVGCFAALLGLALRIHNLGAKSIWWDEAHSWWYASMPLAQGIREGMSAWHGAAGDPLYTVLLHLWISIVGDGEFAMRYLSTLISLLTVAYLSRVTTRAFGVTAGRLALLVGAVAPVWVFYSQEVRQYALTPALMLIMVDAAIQLVRGKQNPPLRAWIQLAAGEALALYTHSFLVFAVAGINAWLLLIWLRDARGSLSWLRSWVLSQLGTLVVIAPTLPNYFKRLQAGHNPFVETLRLQHIVNAQWSLFMGIPWEHATDDLPLRWFAVLVLLALLIGLAVALRRTGSRLLADLVWLIALIQGATALYWTLNPVLHPRYMLFLTAPLFIVLGRLLAIGFEHRGWRVAVSALLVIGLAGLSVFSVSYLYEGTKLGYRHDPAREMTAIVRGSFGPEDGVITIDPNDYTLFYYGYGEAAYFRAGLDDGDHTPADLVRFIGGKQKIGVVQFHAERSDQRGIIPFYLERYGSRTEQRIMPSYGIYTYEMDAASDQAVITLDPVSYSWGNLSLTGISVDSGDAVTIALRWEALADFNTETRYASIVRLVDPETGWLLGSQSTLLLSDSAAPTSEWHPGETATQYYVLPLYPGTPPIEVDVVVALVDSATAQPVELVDAGGAPAGQQAAVAQLTLGEAPDRWVYADSLKPFAMQPSPASILTGYATDWPTTAPGGTVALTLEWAISPEQLDTQQVQLQLVQNGVVIGSTDTPPLGGRQTSESIPWLDRRVLHVSGDAQPGSADLVLIQDGEHTTLGQVEVFGFQRITERPGIASPFEADFGEVIRLVGYRLDIPDPLTSASTIPLTLYWEVLADGSPGADYVVTAQLLSGDGRLIGQHDGIPVNGTRPTSGWLTGEYLIDEHPIAFREAYTGEATLQVALYDPVTFERLRTSDGLDAVALPVLLAVESGE